MGIVWSDGKEGGTKRTRELAQRARARLSQQSLQLRPSVLDRIEVGRVARKEDEACAASLDQIAHPRDLVRAEFVENHDVPRPQLGSEALLDVRFEGAPVHRSV